MAGAGVLAGVGGGSYRGPMTADTADTAVKGQARPRTYGPVQVPKTLGLARWEWHRALADGLIPPPGVPAGATGARWTQAQMDGLLARRDEIKAKVGDVADLGAWQAAEVLAERLGVDVDPDAVVELARTGLIDKAGFYKGHRLYSGRSIAAFRDVAAFTEAAVAGRKLTSEQAAAYLRIRRLDFDRLVRAEWVKPSGSYQGQWSSTVLVFRTGSLDALAADPRIDLAAVRATPKGRPSPLAALLRAPAAAGALSPGS